MSGRRWLWVKETAGAKILPQEDVQGKSRRPVCLEQTEQGRGVVREEQGAKSCWPYGLSKELWLLS